MSVGISAVSECKRRSLSRRLNLYPIAGLLEFQLPAALIFDFFDFVSVVERKAVDIQIAWGHRGLDLGMKHIAELQLHIV